MNTLPRTSSIDTLLRICLQTSTFVLYKEPSSYILYSNSLLTIWTPSFIQANNDELNENHIALQQQYMRLSSDHKSITEAAKKDYEALKSAKETESFTLQSMTSIFFILWKLWVVSNSWILHLLLPKTKIIFFGTLLLELVFYI